MHLHQTVLRILSHQTPLTVRNKLTSSSVKTIKYYVIIIRYAVSKTVEQDMRNKSTGDAQNETSSSAITETM